MEKEKSFNDRIQSFATDPELAILDKKYDPYLEIHKIDDILDTCDIIETPPSEAISAKLWWNTDYDLPTELKRDVIKLFNRHFVD